MNKKRTVSQGIKTVVHISNHETEDENHLELECRLVCVASVRAQVLSALWIIKVGVKFAAKLSKNSYGCRLWLEPSIDADALEFKSMQRMNEQSLSILKLPSSAKRKSVFVAITCFKTSESSWLRMARNEADPERSDRFFRLSEMINNILRHQTSAGPSKGRRVDYLVLPELCMPESWFEAWSRRLAASGISLISGIEYVAEEPIRQHSNEGDLIHAPKFPLRNEVRISLTRSGNLAQPLVLRQKKSRPAIGELRELADQAGAYLSPQRQNDRRFLVFHNEFAFSTLICSELMHSEQRVSLRGKIDALFVPEWNSDTGSFASLVDSSAIDLHAYIVQVNNRLFGDCVIRSPAKKDYERDVARVRGGDADYFVVGEVKFHELRQFQSAQFSPEGPYKPTSPDFRISMERRCQPLKKK
jgi:hypothetical protein